MRHSLSSKLVTALGLAFVIALGSSAASAFQEGSKTKAKDKAKPKEAAVAKVDVNNATAADLEELPQVGPVNAKKIVDNRPYRTYKDLEEKAGLNTRVIDAIRGHIHFGAAESAKPAPKPAAKPAAKPAPKREPVEEKAKETTTPKVAAPAPKVAAPREKVKADAAKTTPAKTKTTLPPGTKVNINTASREELDALPGIGPVKSQAIIDGRPFTKIEDIMKVNGIKEGEFSKIKDMIKVK